MADNILVEPGKKNAVNVATDEVDSVHYPIYKMATGADGEAELVDSDNPLHMESDSLLLESRQVQNLLTDILNQTKLQTAIMQEAYNSTLTVRDIE